MGRFKDQVIKTDDEKQNAQLSWNWGVSTKKKKSKLAKVIAIRSKRDYISTKWGLSLYPYEGRKNVTMNIKSYQEAVQQRDESLKTGRYLKAWIWQSV